MATGIERLKKLCSLITKPEFPEMICLKVIRVLWDLIQNSTLCLSDFLFYWSLVGIQYNISFGWLQN